MHKAAPFDLDDLAFRAPTADDAQRTHALIVRCDVRDYGEPDTDLGDLVFSWEQIDLARDAWLVTTPAGDLVGYGAVISWRTSLEYSFYVDPSWPTPDLGQALLARCKARGQEVAQGCSDDLVARTYIAHTNRQEREIVQRAGFSLAKYHLQMEVRLDGPPPAPAWPVGVTVRTALPEQDGRALYRLIETAFAWPGRAARTYEEWQKLMMGADILDPDLWFVAVAGEAIVGACLSFAYPELGWVRQLAVDEAWRRRGLGTALLNHAFGVFSQRGYDRIGLAVESENPRALAFYRQVGMQPVRQHDEYALQIERQP
jgi:ribosomal protein S18 acetylase RimI-like enzyme